MRHEKQHHYIHAYLEGLFKADPEPKTSVELYWKTVEYFGANARFIPNKRAFPSLLKKWDKISSISDRPVLYFIPQNINAPDTQHN